MTKPAPIALVLALCAAAAFALDPQRVAVTNIRDEAEDLYVSQTEIVRGRPILFTNCLAYSGSATSSAPQDLTGLALYLRVGLPETSHVFTAAAQLATAGAWWCSFTMPTNWIAPRCELSLSNAAAGSYAYPLKRFKTREPF